MMRKNSVTLMELLTVIFIIATLIIIAIPIFSIVRERDLIAEVKGALKQMSMAEKFYYLEQDEYYPSSGSESNIDNINDNLKLQLSERYWDYLCNNAGCVQAERNGEYWHLSVDDSDGEVDSGACP